MARGGKDLRRIALCPKTSYDRGNDLETFVAFKQAGATDGLVTEKLDNLCRGLDSMARDILPRVRE